MWEIEKNQGMCDMGVKMRGNSLCFFLYFDVLNTRSFGFSKSGGGLDPPLLAPRGGVRTPHSQSSNNKTHLGSAIVPITTTKWPMPLAEDHFPTSRGFETFEKLIAHFKKNLPLYLGEELHNLFGQAPKTSPFSFQKYI